jgi:MoxR-like ATPase
VSRPEVRAHPVHAGPDAGRHHRHEFQRGPVFSQILLADEINRATPKTQSALLEAMQERQVSVSATMYTLEEPFLVLATQNPIEMEGTYPLPEAQVDRFLFKLKVETPSLPELVEIMERTSGPALPAPAMVANGATIRAMQAFAREVPAAEHVKLYAARLVRATHPHDGEAGSMAKRFVRYGSSPRGAQALLVAGKVRALMEGRANVSVDDLQALALSALRHRVLLNFEGEAEGVDPDEIVKSIVAEIPPTPAAAT